MEQFTDLQGTNIYQPSVADTFATEYASTGQRFLNYIIDTIVMYIFAFGTGTVLAVFYYASGNETGLDSGGSFNVVLMLVMLFLIVAYYTFSEAVSHGRSIGKLITRTKW